MDCVRNISGLLDKALGRRRILLPYLVIFRLLFPITPQEDKGAAIIFNLILLILLFKYPDD